MGLDTVSFAVQQANRRWKGSIVSIPMKLKYALLIAALTLAAISVFADTVINHIPYKISAPGNYSLLVNYTGNAGNLGNDLNSGAIQITANNVVLEF